MFDVKRPGGQGQAGACPGDDLQYPYVQLLGQFEILCPVGRIQVGVNLDQQRIVSEFLKPHPVVVLQDSFMGPV